MIWRFRLPRKAIRLMKIADGTRAVPLWEILRLTRSGRIKVFLPAFMEFIAAQHVKNSPSTSRRLDRLTSSALMDQRSADRK